MSEQQPDERPAGDDQGFDEYWSVYGTMLLWNQPTYTPERVFQLTKDAAEHAWRCRPLAETQRPAGDVAASLLPNVLLGTAKAIEDGIADRHDAAIVRQAANALAQTQRPAGEDRAAERYHRLSAFADWDNEGGKGYWRIQFRSELSESLDDAIDALAETQRPAPKPDKPALSDGGTK